MNRVEQDSITNGFLKIYPPFLDLHINANMCLWFPSIGVYFLFWVHMFRVTACEDEILTLSSSDCSSGKKITLLQYFHHPGCFSHCVTFQISLGLPLRAVSRCASWTCITAGEKYFRAGTHGLPAFSDKVELFKSPFQSKWVLMQLFAELQKVSWFLFISIFI